jgi:hypothetical protein
MYQSVGEIVDAKTVVRSQSSLKTMNFVLCAFFVVLLTGQTEALTCVLLPVLLFLYCDTNLSNLVIRRSFTLMNEWLSGLALIPRFLSAYWSGYWQRQSLRSMAPVDITAELQ